MKFKRTPPPAELAKLLPGVKMQESPWNSANTLHKWDSKTWSIEQHKDGGWGALLVYAGIKGDCYRADTLKEAIARARKDWRKQRNCCRSECTAGINELMKELGILTRERDSLCKLKVI